MRQDEGGTREEDCVEPSALGASAGAAPWAAAVWRVAGCGSASRSAIFIHLETEVSSSHRIFTSRPDIRSLHTHDVTGWDHLEGLGMVVLGGMVARAYTVPGRRWYETALPAAHPAAMPRSDAPRNAKTKWGKSLGLLTLDAGGSALLLRLLLLILTTHATISDVS